MGTPRANRVDVGPRVIHAVVYGRVSTDEQAESGAGLDAGEHACMARAAREGWTPVGPFVEPEGVGGTTPIDRRPALLEALAALGKGDVLLVAKRDRLGRDPILVAMIEAAARRKGARIVSAAGEGTDGDEAGDVLMRRIVDAFAEYERLVIKARTRAALRAKRRRGERVGQLPYGFEPDPDGPADRDGRALRVRPVPAQLEAIALIGALRAAGETHRAIAARLNARGIPSQRAGVTCKDGRRYSGRWTHSAVASVLKSHPDWSPHAAPPEAAPTAVGQ